MNDEGIARAKFVGYSMGAMAGTFAFNADKISECLWLSPALDYPEPVIDFIRKQIVVNKEGYLKEFYKACFVEEAQFNRFWKELGQDFSETLSTDTLLHGLDFLAKTTLQIKDYDKTPSDKIIFGCSDSIVPENNRHSITDYFKTKCATLPQTGHYVLYALTPNQSDSQEGQSSQEIQA